MNVFVSRAEKTKVIGFDGFFFVSFCFFFSVSQFVTVQRGGENVIRLTRRTTLRTLNTTIEVQTTNRLAIVFIVVTPDGVAHLCAKYSRQRQVNSIPRLT